MKKVFFTVGPSQLYQTVPQHIQTALDDYIPSISHRGQQFKEIYKNTAESLRQLMDIPSTHHVFFLGSSVEAMERCIENTDWSS